MTVIKNLYSEKNSSVLTAARLSTICGKNDWQYYIILLYYYSYYFNYDYEKNNRNSRSMPSINYYCLLCNLFCFVDKIHVLYQIIFSMFCQIRYLLFNNSIYSCRFLVKILLIKETKSE